MKAFVSKTYSGGRRIPNGKKIPTHCGDLAVGTGEHPVLNRITTMAHLFRDDNLCEIEPLYDVLLTSIAMKGLRLRGFEVIAGKEVAQEWWVRFESDDLKG
jgi:hypothetical protein